jgi:hypothetical protein
MQIKYSSEKPPVLDRCEKEFGVKWEKGIIITYGDTVHSIGALSQDLVVHEATHVKQQEAMGKDKWWDKYFEDKEFRLSQEVEAYRNQYQFIRDNYSRPIRRTSLKRLATHMTTLYAGMCTYDEAVELLNPTT